MTTIDPTPRVSRRAFLRSTGLAAASGIAGAGGGGLLLPRSARAIGMDEIPRGERPAQDPSVILLNPRGRVPVSFIIDDSTCLVNMAHFAMPQFAAAWPDRAEYRKPWRDWPREIPDAFVRTFGEWCREHGVKGKYSIVPYPSLVGRVDRELPGWSRNQLRESLQLVRDLMVPDWDIHPEMITHTRVINTRTGQPYEETGPRFMENWGWTDGKSVDELADYTAYALRILRNADLPCDGVTTPGGFAGAVKSEFSQAAGEAVRDVFPDVDVPHYFKYLETGAGSTAPRVEHARDLKSGNPQCVVNVVGGTGDWFGGWDGVTYGDIDESVDKFVTPDGTGGRMVEMIERDEPAIMLCHWPGIWCNGEEVGFRIFQHAVTRLHEGYRDRIRWMKLTEIARYWAARELTAVTRTPDGTVVLEAPFAAADFTLRLPWSGSAPPRIAHGDGAGKADASPLEEIRDRAALRPGTWLRDGDRDAIACFDLRRGRTRITAG